MESEVTPIVCSRSGRDGFIRHRVDVLLARSGKTKFPTPLPQDGPVGRVGEALLKGRCSRSTAPEPSPV